MPPGALFQERVGAARIGKLLRLPPNRSYRFRTPMASGEKGLTANWSHDIVNRRMAIDRNTKRDPLCCPPDDPPWQTNFSALEGTEADEELAKMAKAIG